jgi:hypothetical protein
MRLPLRLHPDFRCEGVTGLAVDIARTSGGLLTLAYRVTGAPEGLYLPPPVAPDRADELWKRTCFEAFVRPAGGSAYFEFNFSPSTRWATYRFSAYRAGMASPAQAAQPQIAGRAVADGYELDVSVDLSRMPELPPDRPWRIGVAAVIEEANGGKSYWALTHPPGKADFHHADGFSLELASPEVP